ncbi:MAG: hypothetical protein D6732_00275 [Methanobacteriota archaeon]|nr:MAG: hypothetical protein D6732_00275 [Euryarchaeota archaeon]
MSKRRIVKTYSNTRAKGERYDIEGNRYFVKVELVSIKMLEEADALGRTSEIYLECGKSKMISKRFPTKGEIHLDRNEVFKPRGRITLYTEVAESDKGGSIEIPFKVKDKDFGKDETLIDTTLSVTLGQTQEFLAFEENGVKVKISIAGNKTRY